MRGIFMPLAVLLLLAAPAGVAAQDPAAVDGAQVADPAAVFARPAGPRPSSDLARALAQHRDSMLDPLRTAQDAMGEMGRQLMTALRGLERGFDAGRQRASNQD